MFLDHYRQTDGQMSYRVDVYGLKILHKKIQSHILDGSRVNYLYTLYNVLESFTDGLPDQVSYILDAHWYRESSLQIAQIALSFLNSSQEIQVYPIPYIIHKLKKEGLSSARYFVL